MKAVTYQGMKNVKVKEVSDASIQNPDDVLVRITTTAICGSDLHIYNGEIPNMPDNSIRPTLLHTGLTSRTQRMLTRFLIIKKMAASRS